MEVAYWAMSPIERFARHFKLSPHLFSWGCFILGLASGVTAGMGRMALAGGFSIVSALFDALDGQVARARGLASDSGEVLDAAVDRYTEFFFLAGLTFYYRNTPWALLLVQLALLGSYMVSYSQAKAEAFGLEAPKGLMRRPERAVYLSSGAFLSSALTPWLEPGQPYPVHYLLMFCVSLVAIFANATAVRRFVWLYRVLKKSI